ncbi:MAG: hypothetical protein JWL65_5380 [Gammaproteobacteria bacterium]|nr:hypothetical protein [Gammaproteobacteria bacterium]
MSDTPISPAAGALTAAGVALTLVSGTVTARVPTIGSAALAGVAPSLAVGIGPVVSIERPFESATITWPNISNGVIGAPSPRLSYRQASFQATGVFGSGGSVKVQGSNDGINWADLSPGALTGAGLFAGLGASERPKYFRPNVTAGDTTTAITITGWLN